MKKNKKQNLLIALSGVVIILIVVLLYILLTFNHSAENANQSTFQDNSSKPNLIIENQLEDANSVRCPADVKKCLDGSYVSRIPPDCTFALCREYVQTK